MNCSRPLDARKPSGAQVRVDGPRVLAGDQFAEAGDSPTDTFDADTQ